MIGRVITMRIIGLLAIVVLFLLVFGRIFGRDALLFVSVACNIAVLGLKLRAWIAELVERARREETGS
jgi:hypothetical protein